MSSPAPFTYEKKGKKTWRLTVRDWQSGWHESQSACTKEYSIHRAKQMKGAKR